MAMRVLAQDLFDVLSLGGGSGIEANCKGLKTWDLHFAVVAQLFGQTDNRSGIQPATKVRRHSFVAAKVASHYLLKQREKMIGVFVVAPIGNLPRGVQIVIAPTFHAPRAHVQTMRRLEAAGTFEERLLAVNRDPHQNAGYSRPVRASY